MSKLVIRKRVTLEFLGDEYKEAYLVFRSIPVSEYDGLLTKIKGVGEDNSKANDLILGILKSHYIEGKFPDDKGELEALDGKEELDGLDRDALLQCFGVLTGQDIKAAADAPEQGVTLSPKSDTPSKPGSTPANQPPQK